MIGNDQRASLAAAMLEFRRLRTKVLPADMFGEPGWDLLLELFVADAKGEQLTGFQVSERCGVAPSVLSRWLRYLSKAELIIGDGRGDLSEPLTLSGTGMLSVEGVMTRARSLQIAFEPSADGSYRDC